MEQGIARWPKKRELQQESRERRGSFSKLETLNRDILLMSDSPNVKGAQKRGKGSFAFNDEKRMLFTYKHTPTHFILRWVTIWLQELWGKCGRCKGFDPVKFEVRKSKVRKI